MSEEQGIPKLRKISKHKDFNRQGDADEAKTEAPKGSDEAREQEYLNALSLSSKVMGDVEGANVRKLIVFEYGTGGWFYSYVNLDGVHDIIEALAPLWSNARSALRLGN